MRPDQRAALLAAKLSALVAGGWRRDASGLRSVPIAVGAGTIDDATRTGWVLIDELAVDPDPLDPAAIDSAPRMARGWLGGAVVWAQRNAVDELHVLADHATAHDARRAALLTEAPALWQVAGREARRLEPGPFVDAPAPDAELLLFREVIESAGADAVIDHGVLRAEVLGLEVGRVEADEDGVPRLLAGVGRHDRLAQSMLHADQEPLDALRSAVHAVRERRTGDAAPHPANLLAPERWMRAVVVADPSLVGAASLAPVEGTEPAALKRPSPAIAVGADADGSPVVVACSVGIDLDAVVFAADARAVRSTPAARLVLVLPTGDDLPAVRLLAERVQPAATIVTISDWKSLPV